MARPKSLKNPNLPALGRLLAEKRKELRLTQVQLAERCLVEPNTVSAWETGKHTPGESHLERLERVLGIDFRPALHGDVVRESSRPTFDGVHAPASPLHALVARLEDLDAATVASVCRIAEAAADELIRLRK